MFSSWRHTDRGRWKVPVRAGLRRLVSPTHGVRVEAAPFARHRSGFSRDFEDLVAFSATTTDKTTITRLSRVDWDSVGRICERVVAEGLDPGHLDGLKFKGARWSLLKRPENLTDDWATAALALVMLSCGPIELHPPHERAPG